MFEKQVVVGSKMGVAADITNNSSAPIYLRERDVQFVWPPEVEPPDKGVWAWDGWFPTEYTEKEQDPRPYLSLKPRETYRVFPGISAGGSEGPGKKQFPVL